MSFYSTYKSEFRKYVKHSFVLFSLLLFFNAEISAQAEVQLVDGNNNEPISFAHIKFVCLSGTNKGQVEWVVSGSEGLGLNPFLDSTLVVISHVGYVKLTDLLTPQESKPIYLTPAIFNLNELVVSGQFIPVEIKESVVDINTIQQKAIEEHGANNLREILNTELNFKTNNGHANETAINLNGLSGNHVKFMIDGVAIEGRLDGNIDLSQINLNEVERIEVIEGPSSVAYGTNALGGIINLITKKQQSKPLSLAVKSYYESVGQYNFSGHIGLQKSRNLYKLSLGRNFFGGFSNEDQGRYKEWKPREQYFGSLMYSRRINHMKLTYVLDGFNETMTSRGIPIGPYNVTAFDTHFKTYRLGNKVLYKGRLKKNNFLDITASQSFYQRTRNIYFRDLVELVNTPTQSDSDQDTTVFNTYMLRTVYNWRADSAKLNFMLGATFKRDVIKAERVENEKQEISDYALFANLSYSPSPSIIIQPALRYAYNSKYNAPLVPSVNLLFHLGENADLRASVAKGFRTPTLKELFIEFHFNSTINLYGNHNLKAESSDHINLSFDYHKDFGKHKLGVKPKLFYSKINNLIKLARVSPINWKYQNLDNLITQGAGLDIKYHFQDLFMRLSFNQYGNKYSQFESRLSDNKVNYSQDAVLGMRYLFRQYDWSISMNYKYTGQLKNYYLDDDNQLKESSIGEFHTLNVTTSKEFYNNKVIVTTGVKNLMNVTDVELNGDVLGVSSSKDASSLGVLWGRTFFVSITGNF